LESIIKVCGVALAAVMAVLLMRQAGSQIHSLTALAAAIAAGLYCVSVLGGVVATIGNTAGNYGLDSSAMGSALKITGICIVCDFTTDLCRESGMGALAGNVELAGKLCVAVISMPLAIELLEITARLLTG